MEAKHFGLDPNDQIKFYGLLKDLYSDPDCAVYFEQLLQEIGLLEPLDRYHVLPSVIHATDGLTPTREQALRLMHIGKAIGNFGKPHFLLNELKEPFVKFFAEMDQPHIMVYFEIPMEKNGVLGELRKVGILPDPVSPNPYDPETQGEESERWWDEHSEEGAQFSREVELNWHGMRYLLIGMMIGGMEEVRALEVKNARNN